MTTQAAELGHGGDDLVRRVYRRIGTVRHRSDVVEYRWRQWFDEKGGALVPQSVQKSVQKRAGKELSVWARRDSNARPLAPEASALSS